MCHDSPPRAAREERPSPAVPPASARPAVRGVADELADPHAGERARQAPQPAGNHAPLISRRAARRTPPRARARWPRSSSRVSWMCRSPRHINRDPSRSSPPLARWQAAAADVTSAAAHVDDWQIRHASRRGGRPHRGRKGRRGRQHLRTGKAFCVTPTETGTSKETWKRPLPFVPGRLLSLVSRTSASPPSWVC